MPVWCDKVKHGVITQPQFSQRTIPYSFISKRVCLDVFAFETTLSGAQMLMSTIHIIISMENIEAFVIVHIKAKYKKHSEATANQNLQNII